jgi:hypothetical protein
VDEMDLINLCISQQKPMSYRQFVKLLRYAKNAGGSGRTARMRKKKMKAACRIWFGPKNTTELIRRLGKCAGSNWGISQ